MNQLADYMPIVKKRMESGGHASANVECELTNPVDLCDGAACLPGRG
ncbi:MAG: hypothetical protein JRG83_07605 [Deltaproteobacteria bacterium]|nr:hypothetical protein [Deltaproteobacteria bacterium]